MAKVVVLAAVAALQVLQLVGALTEPDCTVRQDTPCVGYPVDTFAPGDTVEEILSGLHNQFCGCTHVKGSIQINMYGHDGYTNLTEDSFNFLYHVEEISDVLRFQNIPTVDRIVLPNLRIIRGEELRTTQGRGLSLVLLNTCIGAIVLPNLTEVTRGDVYFQNTTSSMCNYKTVNWDDIIDNGRLDELGACNNSRHEDLLNCSACSSGYCWSTEPLYCQTLTKTPCPSCGLDRCYQMEAGILRCCNSFCAAGCVGPRTDQCHACNNFENNGTCVTQCPPAEVYDPNLFRTVPNPNARLAAGDLCVLQCPEGLFELSGNCLLRCPPNHFSREGQCIPCDGACPTECHGLDTNNIVDGTTIDQFRGCNIITTGGVYIGHISDSAFNLSRLEVLSTITEIRGPLRVQGWQEQTFPYLRNLQRIGWTNGTTLSRVCSGTEYEYSLVVAVNPQLQQLDLSSLETISNGGLIFFNNPQLCYVGNFSMYLENPSQQHQCISVTQPPRRDPETCVNESLICHEQCDSMTSCWGPSDTQCEGCRNFRYLRRCVQDCSNVSLPTNSSGLYQNPDSSVCEPCNSQCLGGCTNGTGPEHCSECRNYYVEEMLGGGPLMRVCVEACPLGTYLNTSLRLCVPCHDGCQMQTGCAGPLPYVNTTDGCLACDRVQLDREGNQVMCLSSGCLPGTYFSTSTAAIGDLESGTDVCIPCHPLCEVCIGPGTRLDDCSKCRYATRVSEQCVRSCNATSEYLQYLQPDIRFCFPCAPTCEGCTGPSPTDCMQCGPGLVQVFSDDRSSFTCRDGCDPGDYISEEGVCEDCHPLCEQCVGPGPSNCTTCRDSRFQAPVETEGSGGGPQLLECFPCTSNQQLINRTCVDTAAPTEEAPTEETPTEGTPTEQTPTEQTPPQETHAEAIMNTTLWSSTDPSQSPTPAENGNLMTILLATLMPAYAVLLLLIVGGLVFVRKRRSRKRAVKLMNRSKLMARNLLYSEADDPKFVRLTEMLPNNMIIPSSMLQLLNAIGEGEFGSVYKARLKQQRSTETVVVAVKTMKGLVTPNDIHNLEEEVLKMQSFNHPNVMSLIGVCENLSGGPAVVMPFMANGSILDYLKKNRKNVVLDSKEKESTISHVQSVLLGMCLQIAKGMEYLADRRVVHRDLAARNCMIDANGLIKVADFGLAEDIYIANYYRWKKGDTNMKLPVRWMSPESTRDGIFTEKSDVWSFGVTCWEVFSGGTVPYGGIRPMALLQLLCDGERLSKPSNSACTDEIYSLLLQCWDGQPEERPDFSQLVVTIATIMEAVAGYLIFSASDKENFALDTSLLFSNSTGLDCDSKKLKHST